MSTLNLKSTNWLKPAINQSNWSKPAINSTSFEPDGIFSESYLLLQNGVDGLLLQGGQDLLGLQT